MNSDSPLVKRYSPFSYKSRQRTPEKPPSKTRLIHEVGIAGQCMTIPKYCALSAKTFASNSNTSTPQNS